MDKRRFIKLIRCRRFPGGRIARDRIFRRGGKRDITYEQEQSMTVEQIAEIVHEANRAYCKTIGDLSQLPTVTELGMIRFNTYYGYVEIFNGVTWVNVAGSTSGISLSQAQDIGIVSALLFG